MKKIEFSQIGVINTPFKEQKDIPIQASFGKTIEASCKIFAEYSAGLKDLDGFSHAILIYYFHQCKEVKMIAKPYLEDKEHGIFAIRGPHRPNKIGFSIVKIKKTDDDMLFFSGVDMLDGTPLLDIKPYVKYFDHQDNTKSGWIEKHFEEGNIPDQTILNNK